MVGQILQNRYAIDARLGEGAMGVVYRAHDRSLGRDVAIKLLSAGADDASTRARLVHEARAAAALNHPNIVAVHDTGEDAGVPFVIMELVTGGNLAGQRALPIERLCEIGIELCAALDHAHTHGIVHRDLKPENVLLGANGTVKLADLGIARMARGTRLTQAGTLLGTADYLAPEQALGAEVDGRADLYALGVVLYELAAGRLPFTGDDALIVISQHLNAPVVPPSTYREGLPPALEAVILKLLAKVPEERYANARATAEALEAASRAPAPATSSTTDGPASTRVLDLLARGRMVGRRAELQQLREQWQRAATGQSHLVLLSGEPGVGKTRLVREVVVHARMVGATVMQGGCYEYEATTPYLPFVEALRRWVHGRSAEALRATLGELAPELARLAPEIAAVLGPLPPSPALPAAEERLRLFDHVARLLQTLSRENGLLLVLDDLHWADQGTLSLLQYLMRNLREEKLLVLGAYREAELDRSHPLAAALVEWNRQRIATRIALQRLPLDATTEMLATLFGQETVSPDFAAALQRETEGNPFFVEEVIKTLIEQGQIYREGADWQRRDVAELVIPQSIRAAVSRRLDRLSEGCTRVLHTAAALGKGFGYTELAAIADTGEDELLDALDEATAAQVVRAEAEGTFIFTHDKIREVLVDELNPIRRRRLHQRIGEGLERLLGDEAATRAQDLAHHFVLSGDLARGMEYSLMAGSAAEKVFAQDEAIHYYLRAREAAESLKRTDDLVKIDERIGRVHEQRGEFTEAVKVFERALALTNDAPTRAALKAQIGATYGNYGDARGLPYLEAALAELDPERQATQRALVLAVIGRYHHYRAKHLAAIEYLEKARTIAEPLGDPQTVSQIYAFFSGAYQHLARFDESMAWSRKNIELGERTGYLEAKRIGYEFIAEDLAWAGEWPETIRYAKLNRELAERMGLLFGLAWSDLPHSWSLHAIGRLTEAAAMIRNGMALCDRLGENRLGTFYRSQLSQVLTDLGDDDGARAANAYAVPNADALGQGLIRCEARLGVVYLAQRRGRWDEVVATCAECYDFMRESENVLYRLRLGRLYGEALLEVGRLDEAGEIIRDTLARARAAKSMHTVALMRRVEGRWLAAQGDRDGAAAAFDEAVATLDATQSNLELPHTLMTRAAFHRANGRPAQAEADRRRAQELFAAIGAWEATQDRATTDAG
jgi:eukaryotic-like serine/threonine-protein kinase